MGGQAHACTDTHTPAHARRPSPASFSGHRPGAEAEASSRYIGTPRCSAPPRAPRSRRGGDGVLPWRGRHKGAQSAAGRGQAAQGGGGRRGGLEPSEDLPSTHPNSSSARQKPQKCPQKCLQSTGRAQEGRVRVRVRAGVRVRRRAAHGPSGTGSFPATARAPRASWTGRGTEGSGPPTSSRDAPRPPARPRPPRPGTRRRRRRARRWRRSRRT